MHDQLTWIDAVCPDTRLVRRHIALKGFHYYGPTAIMQAGAPMAEAAFGGWARLLERGPDPLEFSEMWFEEDGTQRPGIFRCSRRALVDQMLRVEDFARQVREGHGDLYILHLGV